MQPHARTVAIATALLLGFALVHSSARAAPGSLAPDALDRAGNGVAGWVETEVRTGDFVTGSPLFDREWQFGACQMAVLGFAQAVAARPERADALLPAADRCLQRMLAPEGRAFDLMKWGVDPLDALDDPRGHMAWLGYTNLALAARRSVVDDGRWDAINDRLSRAILSRLDRSLAPETYPGERYPVDVAAAVASAGLSARLRGDPEPEILDRWRAHLRARWVVNGVLVQSLRDEATALDRPRGSGTFLAAWFLSWWDPALGADLYRGGRDALFRDLGVVAGMREYLPGQDGPGDVDSGPIVAGLGVSATGFAIGAGLAAGDEATVARLVATAERVGRPADRGDTRTWATGSALGSGPLSDAILYAMMSTPRR